MHKNSIPFSFLLNIVFSVILLAGGYAAYHFGNFGGASLNELKMGYIKKEDIQFKDLPTQLQAHYIDKDAVIEQSKDGSLFEDEYIDEEGKPIPEADVTPRDFKRMVQKLQKTLLFLQHDNLLLANEKNDLLRKIDEINNEREEEKTSLSNKNLEKINDAEQQHYKNIIDLTIKLNELKK
jgi:hypothetical protein